MLSFLRFSESFHKIRLPGEGSHLNEDALVTTIQIKQTALELIEGDITQQAVDAIVNAANTSLLGGGGVDGAIHRAAGPELLEATRLLRGCRTGDAKMTPGFNLPARFVIHAVGPVYNRKNTESATLLESAYRRSFELAAAENLKSIALPAISTGAYGYPLDEAAPIALRIAIHVTEQGSSLELIRFVLFNQPALAAFQTALQTLLPQT
jgi:O-acetyl-ADP-ribose deacetylase (regulator of RNase III)